MTSPVKLVIFASGRGSNFDAIAEAIHTGNLHGEIVGVVSDQDAAPVLEKAKKRGIPAWSVSRENLSRAEHERKILEVILPLAPRFLVMAGYMRLVTESLLAPFRSDDGYYRVVNIHPSLLPAFPGVNAYQQAYDYGAKWTGVTVHLVDRGLDSGPICHQEAFTIEDCLTVDEVEHRGLEIEHRIYPVSLQWILKEEFKLEGRKIRRTRVRTS